MKREFLLWGVLILLLPVFSSASINLDQVSADPYEPDDGFLSASNITLNEVQTHTLTVGDVDYFTFTLNVSSSLVIYTFDSNSDLWMELYNSNQQQIDFDDNSGYNGNPRINKNLVNGTYYFMVRQYSYQDTPEYKVKINQIIIDEEEPNNILEDASTLPFNETITGALGYNSSNYTYDVDWYKLNVTESRQYVITIHVTDYIDAEIYDESGFQIDNIYSQYWNENGYIYIYSEVLFQGIYYIQLSGYDTAYYDIIYNYILPDSFEPNNFRSTATPLSYNTTEFATLHHEQTNDVDWWAVNITSAERASFVILTNMSDIGFELYDENGNYLSYHNSYTTPNGRIFVISRLMEVGLYYLQVYHWASFSGKYQISWGPMQGDQYEPNDVAEDASQVEQYYYYQDFWIQANFHSNDDVDWYYFTSETASTLFIQIYPYNYNWYDDPSLYISVYDENVNLVEEVIDSELITQIDEGIYYIRLEQDVQMVNYELSAHLISSDDYEYDGDSNSATTLRDENTQYHNLHVGTDEDWFKFTINEETSVEIETWGYNGDPQMTLFSSDLTEIEYNDDYQDRFPSIRRILDEGTYYILISSFDGEPVYEYYITLYLRSTNPTNGGEGSMTTSRLEIGFSLGYTLTMMVFSFISVQFIRRKSKR